MLSPIDICEKDEVCNSDHFALCFTVNIKPNIVDKFVELDKRNFRNFDRLQFCKEIENACLLHKFPELSIGQCVSAYNNTLKHALDKQCPSHKIKVRNRPQQKWFNESLKELKRKRRSMERKAKQYKSIWWQHQLKLINTEYKIAINETRATYFNTELNKNKSDSKKVHKKVNYLIGEKQTAIYPSYENELELANDMTTYFSNKIKGIRKEISENGVQSSFSLNHSTQTQSTFDSFTTIDSDALQTILSEMNGKYHSNDPIPTWLLKSCIETLGPILLYLVNRSLEESIFPDVLKHAVVHPTIKDSTGNKDDYKNYRPVSNLTFLSKLIEKCANSQLQTYLQKNNLQPKCQSAYRKGHSCETALLKVVNDLQTEVSSRNMVALVLLDLSSAFDTIDHDLLFHKLQNKFGISGSVLNWIKSYLKNRTFAVKIGNIEGKPVILIYGVPQGSILGPLLFVLYISDVVTIAQECGFNIHLYADDCQFYIGFNPLTDRTSNSTAVQNCFQRIKLWMKNNFLKLNIDKTQVMFLGRPQEISLFDVSLNIEDKDYYSDKNMDVKTLGVLLDSQLKMDKMVSQCIKTCYFNLKQLQSIRRCLDKDTKLMLVTTSILSRLDYCNILLTNVSVTLIKRLQKVLNASIRFIFNLKMSQSVTPYLKLCHILPVKQRIKYKSCILMYKIVYGLSPDYLSSLAFPDVSNRDNLRSSNDLLCMKLPDCQKCIQYSMIQNWNELPYELRSLENVTTFKKKLKTHYFISAFDVTNS